MGIVDCTDPLACRLPDNEKVGTGFLRCWVVLLGRVRVFKTMHVLLGGIQLLLQL